MFSDTALFFKILNSNTKKLLVKILIVIEAQKSYLFSCAIYFHYEAYLSVVNTFRFSFHILLFYSIQSVPKLAYNSLIVHSTATDRKIFLYEHSLVNA